MKKSIFLMFIFLLMPLTVMAVNDINVSCGKIKLKINEETTCKLNVSNLNFNVIDVTGKVKLGNNLQLVSSSYDKGVWLSLDDKFSVTDINLMRHKNDKINSITIATFKIKASANATGDSSVSFNNVSFGNSDYQSVPLSCSPVTIYFGNDINTLQSLNIKGFDIKFKSDMLNYSIDVEQENIFIEAVAIDSKAKISGIGNKNIAFGKNVIDVVVTAENGSKKTYKINVNRKDNRSNINDLSNITLSHGSIVFDKSKTEYVVNVENDVDSIDIFYELVDKKSTAEIIGNSNLIEGENNLIIKVKAENGEVKEYKINIIREQKKVVTASNKISSLKIKDHELFFDKDIDEYVINTDYKKLDIYVLLEDNESKYEIIGNNNLQDGSIITIKVMDKIGNINVYKIKIQNDNVQVQNNNIWLIITLIISILYNIVITIFYLKVKKQR